MHSHFLCGLLVAVENDAKAEPHPPKLNPLDNDTLNKPNTGCENTVSDHFSKSNDNQAKKIKNVYQKFRY